MSKSLSVSKAEKALREHHGVIKYAAEACGVSRQTFWRFMQDHPELEEVRQECDEELLDIGETHIHTAIVEGKDMKTIRWHLERKGKNRGYTTRQEQTGADGGPLEYETVERRIVDPKGGEEGR